MRYEFGHHRSICACTECTRNCEVMPGYLIPSDLKRLIPDAADPFVWAEENLRASPGALVMKDGKQFRIPTLVPASTNTGRCKFLNDNMRCGIHEAAPFGCAFFDCKMPREQADKLSAQGLNAIWSEWLHCGLYRRLWQYLNEKGLVTESPDEKRKRL